MTTTATRCERLELWSGLQCAGGRRLAIWATVMAASMTLTLGLDSKMTAQVPMDAEASIALSRWQVVRVWEDDIAWDEWVITDVTRDDRANVLTFTASAPTILLGRSGLVQERTPDGRVRHEMDRVGLSPTTLLDSLVIAQLVRQGITWAARGTITPTAVRDVSLAWQTPLQVLTLLAQVCPCELDVRRVGTTRYELDLIERVGVDAPQLDVRQARNLLDFTQQEALSEHATVITGKGATLDGESATIADAAWRVAAVSGTVVTLADLTDGPGPIAYDDQLNGLQLVLPTGALVAISDSVAGTQQLTLASAPTLAVDAIVRIVDAVGSDLVSLPCPPAVTDYGAVIGTLERADLPGHRNLISNPVLRAWSGAGSVPPTGWAVVGGVTLSRLTTGPQITRGASALQVVGTASGTGVRTPTATLTPTADRPYLSGYFTLWVVSGQVRVELVATTGAGTKTYPLGGSLATNSAAGVQIDLGLAGIDANAAGITSAYLQVVQHSVAAATWVVESAQLTASVSQLPFVEGSGGNLLWHAVNTKLQTSAIPRLRTTLSLVDLARLDPVRFGPDCSITVGGTARVVLPRRGIDGTARVVQVERDLLNVGHGAITLSDAPEYLTGSLARATWRARPVPAVPIIVLAGDLSATTAFDAAGHLTILVVAPEGSDSIRVAVSTSGMPSSATIDAATSPLRVDGTEIATLTTSATYTAGTLVYVGVRAYKSGVGTRVLQLTDAPSSASAAAGPSLEVRYTRTPSDVTITYAAIGTVTYRLNDALTTTPASPFTIARPAALSTETIVTLYATRNGLTVTESVTIYPIGVDTVSPDLSVLPVTAGALRDSVQYTISASDPSGRGLAITRQMTLSGCAAVGFSGAGPHTLTNGQTVTIVKPIAFPDAAVKFTATAAGNGTTTQTLGIAAQDLTGLGVEMLSNPEFRTDLPRNAFAYDNGGTGLVTVSYGAVSGQNASGQELIITKLAGAGTTPGSGGFGFSFPRNTTPVFVADQYRESALYLVTVRAKIPAGYTLVYTSNPYGTGGTNDALTAMVGTGAYVDYVLRLQIGTGGTLSSIGYWYLSGTDTLAVTWRVARVSFQDLSAPQRQPTVGISARVVGGDATTAIVQVDLTPATSVSRVYLLASTDAPSAGGATGVEVVSGSTWTFPRKAFRTGTSAAYFGGRTPGFEPNTVGIVIPEQGRDTVALGLEVQKVGGDTTTIVARLYPTDPYPQGAGSLTLSYLLGGAASGSPASPIALTSGSPVDVTITKPAVTALPAIVGFTLSNANRVSAYKELDVQPVTPLIAGRIELQTPTQSGASYTIRFKGWLADGVECTSTSQVALISETTPSSGSPVSVTETLTRDTTNGWFTWTFTRVAGSAYRATILVLEQGITARTPISTTIPTYTPSGTGAGAPAITAIYTVNTANLDSGSADGVLQIFFSYVNLPAGGSVQAVFRQGTALPETVTLSSTPTTLRTPVSKLSTNAGRQRLDGSMQMLDSAGAVVQSAAFLSVYYWN